MANRKLAELAQLAQLSTVLQAPQQRQQEQQDQVQARRVAAALQLLGMQQEQDQAAQQQAFQQQRLAQDQGQFESTQGRLKAAQDEESGRFWQGTYPMQLKGQEDEQAARLAGLAQQGVGNLINAQEQQARTETARRGEKLDLTRALMAAGQDPQKASANLPQDMQQPFVQQHQQAVAQEVAKLAPLIKMMDPQMREFQLANVHPDVRAQLLAMVGGPPQAATTPVTSGREGGVLGEPIRSTLAALKQYLAAKQGSVAAQNDVNWNFLFGKPTN